MKAIICQSFGLPDELTFSDLEIPNISSDQVLIKVHYCGVNFPDTLIVQGKYQFQPDFPFSPGGEVCGEIVKVGENIRDFGVGEMVLAAMGWGGFAEYAVADASNVFKLPLGVSPQTAAVILETYGTVIHALKDRAKMNLSERLVVLGASGGTGIAAVQIGNLFGAEVIGVASTAEKRDFVKENGAKYVLSYDHLKSEIKKLGGADVIFDPVGGNVSEEVFRSLRPGGRHLVVGFSSGEVPAIPFNLPLLKSASIVGVFWGHFWRNEPEANQKNVNMLLKWLAEGKLNPQITETQNLKDGAKALQMIMDRKVKGKIVLKVS